MTSDVREFRERCKTNVKIDVRKEGCEPRIDGVGDDDEREGLEDCDAQKEEFGSRNTVRKHDPCWPSEQERIDHEMTHLPFRSGCGHCIKGSGREEDCRNATEEEERRVPEVHLKTRRENVGFCCCPREGDEGCVQHCGAEEIDGRVDLPECVDIIVKSDNEAALTSLIASWSNPRAMEGGSRIDSRGQSSGLEGQLEEQMEPLREPFRRSSLEEKQKEKLEVIHSIWLWIASHARFLLKAGVTERLRTKDGKENRQRCTA